jgi:hypothetical protein
MLLWLSIAELPCGAVVVSHRTLKSSPGWLHCLPLASNCLGNIARGCSSNNCSCVDGHAPCCWRCEDKLAVWPEGCVDGTCRFYMPDEGGIIRNVTSDLA